MNTIIKLFRRGYELLVASGNLLQSPLLLVLRVYFFWQLFMTGQGHLAHIGKVSEFFVSLGIPFPTLNAYLSSSVECFGSLLLMIGLASRLTAIPVAVTMAVAYLTADLEAVTSIFSDPDKFVKADPFPYFIVCAHRVGLRPRQVFDRRPDQTDVRTTAPKRSPKQSLRFGLRGIEVIQCSNLGRSIQIRSSKDGNPQI